uniref:Uncharacterized protein n=1 Tax=Physcomitrium patens TaxID=3218 RepID=A0A7I3YWP7_PHYPA
MLVIHEHSGVAHSKSESDGCLVSRPTWRNPIYSAPCPPQDHSLRLLEFALTGFVFNLFDRAEVSAVCRIYMVGVLLWCDIYDIYCFSQSGCLIPFVLSTCNHVSLVEMRFVSV